ncbi:hypothetical protein ABZ235_31160 [Streptomyces canus]|uniref:hypothetical protein n=1 Tax=Streptomyces canus TaxID=58343 RepID=UPI0033B5C17A
MQRHRFRGSAAEPFCQIQSAAAPVTFSAAVTGDGSPVTVAPPAAGITFSRARYVDMTGIRAQAVGATALAVEDLPHITYRAAFRGRSADH